MSNTSEVMKHFKKIDKSTMSCNLCDKHIKISDKSSVATMMEHINSHKNQLNSNKIKNNASHTLESPRKSMKLERSQRTQMDTSPAAAAPARRSSYSGDKDAKILNAILYYMCIDDKSSNTIHCKGFKYLMKELAPNYKIPSKQTIERRLDEKYDVIVKNFKQQLNETLYVTIGIDTWLEAVSYKNFLIVTVHFIANATKKLESGTIELIELSEYTVDYITSVLRNTLNKWCVDIRKVATVVINPESNIVDKTVTQFLNLTDCIICFVHTINLVAENSMKNCEGFSDIIDKVRLIVKCIKNSTDINNELHQRQVNLGKTEIKKLILDIDFNVRWNNTFHMIERFIELWTVINVLLINHKIPDIKVLTDDELNMLKEIVVLLRPLACMVEECSAENYIVISKIIPLINCALIEYNKTTQTMELSTKLKEAILKELQSTFGQIQSINSISIATILDPRFKTIHFQNTQTLANTMYILRRWINHLNQNELSSVSSSHKSNTEQDKTKYNLWNHHKFLAHDYKDELTLYLAMPISSFNDDPFEKWESMKIQFPSLYKITRECLSIVATPVPAKRLFSKTKMTQSENQLPVERLNKLSFLNSVDKRYWSQ